MSWYVHDTLDPDGDDDWGKRYEDYEVVEALADFFKKAWEHETVTLRWSM